MYNAPITTKQEHIGTVQKYK